MDPLNQLIYDSVQRNLNAGNVEAKKIDLMTKIYLGTATLEEKETFELETNLTEEKIKEFCDIGYHFAAQMDKVDIEEAEMMELLKQRNSYLEKQNAELEQRIVELETEISDLKPVSSLSPLSSLSTSSLEDLALNDQNYSRYL